MNMNGTAYRTIWIDDNSQNIARLLVIDQRVLPHEFCIRHLPDHAAVCEAIRNMTVRGAGLIGAAAGFGLWLAALAAPDDGFDAAIATAKQQLLDTRPTAVNLAVAVQRVTMAMQPETTPAAKRTAARAMAQAIADDDAEFCRRIGQHGVPHSFIADNAGGHLMHTGMVDMVITGTDRVSRQGDAANKIGTYLKALAACDNNVPFYIALPSSTLDFTLQKGEDIPIEERDGDEVRLVHGVLPNGQTTQVRICPESTPARNWAFDVTPARLITGLITERGLCAASEAGILGLFPEHASGFFPEHATASPPRIFWTKDL